MASLADTQRWMLAAITGDDVPDGEILEGRLEIYRRGYRSRLVGCLRATYPGLRHALGDDVFEAFALDYLQAHPPRGYTLDTLGARWPEHLAATKPDGERWPDFLVDLARLERAFHEVYDGDGEDVRLRTSYPVAAYLEAVRRGEDPPLPAPKPSRVTVSRRDWVVTFTEGDEP